MRNLWQLCLTTLILLGNSQTAVFASGNSKAPSPSTIYTKQIGDLQTNGAARALLQRTREKGTIRVLVGLKFPQIDEAKLGPARAAAELKRQTSMANRILQRAFGNTHLGDVIHYEILPLIFVTVNAVQLEYLLRDPEVDHVQEDSYSKASLFKSRKTINAHKLPSAINGGNTIVAVLDTGADRNHPMLKGRIIAEACFSSLAGSKHSLCPNRALSATGPGSAADCNPLIAGCGHGTSVASIAAGTRMPAGRYDIEGIAPGAHIFPIKVFSLLHDPLLCKEFKTDKCV
jgi:subtilisin family serine protease